MKLFSRVTLFVVLYCTVHINATQHYDNDFVTYSIGDRFERGDFMIKNETFESTYSVYSWPKPYRLKYKIMNHDDLLSYAEFNIVNTDDIHEFHVRTEPDCYEIFIESAKRFRGFVKVFHKAPENFHHINFNRFFPNYNQQDQQQFNQQFIPSNQQFNPKGNRKPFSKIGQ